MAKGKRDKRSLTKSLIERLEPPQRGKRRVWDSVEPGLGLYITSTGHRSFFASYFVGRRERRITIGAWPTWTIKDARQEAKSIITAADKGRDTLDERQAKRRGVTVREYAAEWLDQKQAELKSSTMREYRRATEKIIVARLGNLNLCDLNPGDVHRLRNRLKATPYLANRVVAILRSMLGTAKRQGIIKENPAMDVDQYREKSRECIVSEFELARIIKAIDDLDESTAPGNIPTHAAGALRLLIFSGMRKSEVLGLRWDYVDFETDTIILPDTKTGRRVIHLNRSMKAELKRLYALATSDWVIEGKDPRKPLVGLPKIHERVKRHALAEINKERDKAGQEPLKDCPLLHIRLHDYRHNVASRMASSGMSASSIQSLLGHKNLSTSEKYIHYAEQAARAASDRAADLIGEAIAAGGKVIEL